MKAGRLFSWGALAVFVLKSLGSCTWQDESCWWSRGRREQVTGPLNRRESAPRVAAGGDGAPGEDPGGQDLILRALDLACLLCFDADVQSVLPGPLGGGPAEDVPSWARSPGPAAGGAHRSLRGWKQEPEGSLPPPVGAPAVSQGNWETFMWLKQKFAQSNIETNQSLKH